MSDEDEQGWEEGVEETFDKAFDTIANMGAKPIALCIFAIGDNGNLVFETAGSGELLVTTVMLAEGCLEVSDHLEAKASKLPGYRELRAKLEEVAKNSK